MKTGQPLGFEVFGYIFNSTLQYKFRCRVTFIPKRSRHINTSRNNVRKLDCFWGIVRLDERTGLDFFSWEILLFKSAEIVRHFSPTHSKHCPIVAHLFDGSFGFPNYNWFQILILTLSSTTVLSTLNKNWPHYSGHSKGLPRDCLTTSSGNSKTIKIKIAIWLTCALAAINAGCVGSFKRIKILLGSYPRVHFFELRSNFSGQ